MFNEQVIENESTTDLKRKERNFKRARLFKFNKVKNQILVKYSTSDLFVFELLKKNIKIINSTFKNTLNSHIAIYEGYLEQLRKCKNHDELNKKLELLENSIKQIDTLINKNNFKEYVLKGYFTCNNVNLKDTEEYSNTETQSVNTETQPVTTHSPIFVNKVDKNISYASILKK